MTTLSELAEDFPGRVAGSVADRRAGAWVADRLARRVSSRTSTRSRRPSTARRSRSRTSGLPPPATPAERIVVLATRDSPPLATQGADDNASGIAAVLELAHDLRRAPHHAHPIVFLWTDGDAYGALGARDFVTGTATCRSSP